MKCVRTAATFPEASRFLPLLVILAWLAPTLGGQLPMRSAGAAVVASRRSTPQPTTRYVIGYSVEHRPIVAVRLGSAAAKRSLLVVGSIAGDEPGGIAVVDALRAHRPIPGVAIWLISNMNPDGLARRTRVNADGVDLNRNFSFAWRAIAPLGSRNYPGPRPLSEPESRAVAAFIRRVRPTLSIWLHQPYALVDDSQGPMWAEELVAHAMGLPLDHLSDYPGSAIGWEDHLISHSAFDLELPGSTLSNSAIGRCADAIMHVARNLSASSRVTR